MRSFFKTPWRQFKRKIGNPLTQHCSEFCSRTSIHGILHLAANHGHPWDRLFWLAMFVLALLSCGMLISSVYRKWIDNPVIISFGDEPVSVLQIPFPAVTVCPEMKFRPDVLNYSGILSSLGDYRKTRHLDNEIFEIFCSVTQVCDKAFRQDLPTSQDIVDTLKQVSPIKEMGIIFSCVLGPYLCGTSSFQETITDRGVCYSFNLLPTQELLRSEHAFHHLEKSTKQPGWSIDEGFTSYPSRTPGSGIDAGLRLGLQLPKDPERDDPLRCRRNQGFRIALHSPSEYPAILKNTIHLDFNQAMTLTVEPAMIATSKDLSKYSPNRRRCYFGHERRLQFFAVYTQDNCEVECLANHTRQLCSCVRFWMRCDRWWD